MNWLEEVNLKLKRNNQLLLTKDSQYLQDLTMLFKSQPHRVMALWAFDFAAESILQIEEKYPNEKRPKAALAAAQDWAAGKIKMRLAQRKILDCHAFAKELSDRADIATCHAVGQACSVVHTAGHAIGYPLYDLTAIIFRLGVANCLQAVEARKQKYIDRLFYWQAHWHEYEREWAAFMLK